MREKQPEADREATSSAPPEAIIVGKRAVNLTLEGLLGEDAPHEYVTTEANYERLATQDGWQRQQERLVGGSRGEVHVRTSYGNQGYSQLRARGRTTDSGLVIAGLPDIYAVMQREGDTLETARLRAELLSPAQPPLPVEIMPREHSLVAGLAATIPDAEQDPQYTAAIRLASHALYTLFSLYGDPDIRQVNQIVGTFEKPDYGVRAFYHNAFDVLLDGYDLQTYFDRLGNRVSTADRLDGLVAELYTDIVYGNGRKRDTPHAYDELCSANLLYQLAVGLEYPPARAERLRQIVLGTCFDEESKSQPGRKSRDLVVQGVTAVDLQVLARPGEGVPSSQDITLENLMSRRRHASRVLGRAACRENAVLLTREDGLDFVREHYRMPVKGHPTAATLGEAHEHEMLGSADFHETYVPPKEWMLDDPEARRENARMARHEAMMLAA